MDDLICMRWYRVDKYGVNILPVRAVSFTDKTVTVLESWMGKARPIRHLRKNDFFPTFDGAKEYLIQYFQARLAGAEKSVMWTKTDLVKAAALLPSED